MKSILVKDIMVPLSEYTTVTDDAMLSDALNVLEAAQEEFNKDKNRHKSVLVCEKKSGKVIGKLSQLDVIRALEPKYESFTQDKTHSFAGTSHFGFSPKFMKDILEQYELWYDPIKDMCKRADFQKVKDIMYTPSSGEFVKEKANLGEAIHQIIMGHHQSLLVTRNEYIVGVLRLTDIFRIICSQRKM
ncbi:MAG: CBS domain-containing protein [Desulfobacterales bacterium]|nr:CBS domain-containing protein [Desulfobacterales bacterium]